MRFKLAAHKPLSDMTVFVEKVVEKAGLQALDLDEVLLAAPSSDTKTTNPEEISTKGAAIQAALVEGFDIEEITESLQPVVINTQHLKAHLGIKDASLAFHPLLVAYTAYPIKKSVEVTNGSSSDVRVELYEAKRTVKETVIEQAPESDTYSDSDFDDKPKIKREVEYVAGDLLARLVLADLTVTILA